MRLDTKRKLYRNLYIFTLCVSMFGKIGSLHFPWWFHYLHTLFWIFLYLYKHNWRFRALSQSYQSYLGKCQYVVWKIFMIPYLICWLFTPLGYFAYMEETTFRMLTRSVSITLQMTLIYLSVLATANFFKEKLLKYTFISMVINYALVFFITLAWYGVTDFLSYGLTPWKEFGYYPILHSSYALEVHDLTFAAGLFFIYVIVYYNQITHRIVWFLCCLFIIYFGYKRLEVLMCLLLPLLNWLININGRKSLRFWNYVYSIGILSICGFWIWSIDSHFLMDLLPSYGISLMSRDTVYLYMSRFFKLSPRYIGRGMSAGIKINEKAVANGISIILGHSDILFRYIDLGFWGFGMWVLFSTWSVTRMLYRQYGNDSAKLWIILTVYAFSTYLTDNTLNYFVFQTSYAVIMFHSIYEHRYLATKNK